MKKDEKSAQPSLSVYVESKNWCSAVHICNSNQSMVNVGSVEGGKALLMRTRGGETSDGKNNWDNRDRASPAQSGGAMCAQLAGASLPMELKVDLTLAGYLVLDPGTWRRRWAAGALQLQGPGVSDFITHCPGEPQHKDWDFFFFSILWLCICFLCSWKPWIHGGRHCRVSRVTGKVRQYAHRRTKQLFPRPGEAVDCLCDDTRQYSVGTVLYFPPLGHKVRSTVVRLRLCTCLITTASQPA